jgi:hypothetical protein
MKILYLEDNLEARKNIELVNDGRFQIDFIDTVTLFHAILFEQKGYESYEAIVMDLNIDMPLLLIEEISKKIPELSEEPTFCNIKGKNIPLYGLDYFIRVITVKNETKTMLEQGRIIFFTGHAAKIIQQKLYDKEQEEFKHVELLDRAKDTRRLFFMLERIEKMQSA